MRQKKERSTATVLLCIFFLALFIILPPIFRLAFPRTETKSTNENMSFLTCKRDVYNENYNIYSKTLYQGDKFSKVTITYTLYSDNSNLTYDSTLNELSALSEISSFRATTGIQIEEVEEQTIIELDKNTKSLSTENPVIDNYTKDKISQMEYYKSFGFDCQEVEV